MKVVLEKRLEQTLKAQIGLPVLSALMALVFAAYFCPYRQRPASCI